MNYWQNIEQNIYSDLLWNIPEIKTGTINITGGNSQNFQPEIKISEEIIASSVFNAVNTIFPDALKSKLPPLPNFIFLSSTETGSFEGERELTATFNAADFNLIFGDLSKNSLTKKAIVNALINTTLPTLVTRDAVDLIAEDINPKILEKNNLFLLATMSQLQKIFKNSYYPKMILLSAPLTQIVETLHKFTLSYPLTIITFLNGKIIVASGGKVATIPIENTPYNPLTLWNGKLASKIIAVNLFNSNKIFEASVAAIF